MKLMQHISLIIVFIATLSCEKSHDTPPNQITLNGSWNMENVSGGLIGLDLDYNPGEVIWVFNTTTNQLLVTNNILSTGPKSIYARFQTGTYNYYISNVNPIDELYVDTVLIGDITIGTSSLHIDDGLAADGFLTVFRK